MVHVFDTCVEQLHNKVTTMDTWIIRMDTKTDDMYVILYMMACKSGVLTHSSTTNHQPMLGWQPRKNDTDRDDMELDGMASKLAKWGDKVMRRNIAMNEDVNNENVTRTQTETSYTMQETARNNQQLDIAKDPKINSLVTNLDNISREEQPHSEGWGDTPQHIDTKTTLQIIYQNVHGMIRCTYCTGTYRYCST